MRKIELLAPARDIAIGKAAIDNGADAVYIGGPAFGARKSAGNSLDDIAALVEYAHRFYCRVFVTLNTILFDSELAEVEQMIKQLYRIGVDALIIQDPGILKLDIPPISLHASTQMHNYDMERIRFLDRLGFQRIVLARELSLEQIKAIRKEIKAELEVFIHGALCVSMSGQCYLSQYMFGRSANRGECAQPCRMKWSLKDSRENRLIRERYLLSLKDLNLSEYIPDLIESGIDSLKIEGRLKDESYVANVTNHYHRLIEAALKQQCNVGRVGTGMVSTAFEPDPERSFNRGCSSYFFTGRPKSLVNMNTPKSVGKPIGKVLEVRGNRLLLDTVETLSNGDGLCYLQNGELKGIRVNIAEGNRITANEPVKVAVGTMLYRNYDRRFITDIEKQKSIRKIRITIGVEENCGKLKLTAIDEDNTKTEVESGNCFEKASNSQQKERILQQLKKCGDTCFVCKQVHYSGDTLFIPSAELNTLKRKLLDNLMAEREKVRKIIRREPFDETVVYKTNIDWHGNVVNRKAEEFYKEHGAQNVEEGFEKTGDAGECDVMRTRYCILHELGRCRKKNTNKDLEFPLYLYNDKHCFRLEFDCTACCMKVIVKK
ncbi:peptidase U32 family protein [Odoribacter lunatus]|uniref:peptidase U32 family protein n=1 Tax=Odoribacter lunatus TaxID=2941335 RepID=UPI0020419A00|nr:U32 family peptidase [Odoribacter lunatus]